jgi:Ca2+-binding RTX toxin-like protein
MVGIVMEVLLMAALLFGAAWSGDGGSDDSDDSDTPSDTVSEVDPLPVEPSPEDGGQVEGENVDDTFEFTDGDDVFIAGTTEAEFTGDTVDMGAGNDTFDLLTSEPVLVEGAEGPNTIDFGIPATTVSGGDGDDVIMLRPQNITVEGNDGNDTIVAVNAAGATIDGGAGNDMITVTNPATSGVTVRGGEGEDIIDATQFDNGSVDGGAGNDTISFNGGNQGGAGYVKFVSGGEGDDTLNYVQGAPTNGTFEASTVTGDAGADTFNLTINEGEDFTDAPPIDETQTLPLINIGDFTTGEDMLVIDATSASDAFNLTTARLDAPDEDSESDQTSLILRYESDTEADRDVVIQLGTGPVVWDDISLIGVETPLLIA